MQNLQPGTKRRVKGGSAPPPPVAQSLCQWSTDEQRRSRSGAFSPLLCSNLLHWRCVFDIYPETVDSRSAAGQLWGKSRNTCAHRGVTKGINKDGRRLCQRFVKTYRLLKANRERWVTCGTGKARLLAKGTNSGPLGVLARSSVSVPAGTSGCCKCQCWEQQMKRWVSLPQNIKPALFKAPLCETCRRRCVEFICRFTDVFLSLLWPFPTSDLW